MGRDREIVKVVSPPGIKDGKTNPDIHMMRAREGRIVRALIIR